MLWCLRHRLCKIISGIFKYYKSGVYLVVSSSEKIAEGRNDSFFNGVLHLLPAARNRQVADGPRGLFLCWEIPLCEKFRCIKIYQQVNLWSRFNFLIVATTCKVPERDRRGLEGSVRHLWRPALDPGFQRWCLTKTKRLPLKKQII